MTRYLTLSDIFRFQTSDEGGIHITVVVGDMQADDALPGDLLAELRAEAIAVPALHHKDEIGPAEVARGHANAGTIFGSRRAGLVTGDPIEDLLGRQAPPPILATDEQELHWASSQAALAFTLLYSLM
ncbi:hypothetical protein EKD04_002420 [Chloroflexales bacterium ZM16-3]|nr:hypothetical protein [Chloroflexales bacterium ZM16-3]